MATNSYGIVPGNDYHLYLAEVMCTILTVAFLLAAAVMVSSTLLPDIATGSTTYPYETMETWTGPLEAEGRGSNNTLPPTYISGNESVVVRASRTIYYRVGMSIQRYYLPVIVPIGLVGTTLFCLSFRCVLFLNSVASCTFSTCLLYTLLLIYEVIFNKTQIYALEFLL